MRAVAMLGIVLIVIGVVSLAMGGFTYTKKESVVKVGPLEVTAQEKETFPISPLAGGVMVTGGLIFLVVGSGRR